MGISSAMYERALQLMPGGVNSPVRAFNAVGGTPRFIRSASGCTLTDADGNSYIDYMLSWGPLILGHAHPTVVQAVTDAARRGLSYGAPHEAEILLAEMVQQAIPAAEMVRLVSSGTEATMSAVRLARAATGRDKLIKFRGCYHGHADSFLISAGSGALTHSTPSSPGVTRAAAADTLLADYNDLSSVEACFAQNPDTVAALIVEPVAGNMGLVPPRPEFLPGLRSLCDRYGALLIFDEVITGFRLHYGAAADLYGVRPDLLTLGKILGGGMPLGAYCGRRELMRMVSPAGPVYQAGTLSGNPVACAAGIATLRALKAENPYPALESAASTLEAGMRDNLAGAPFAWTINRSGSAFTLFFGIDVAETFTQVQGADTALYARYFSRMLAGGVYLPPAQYEACFVSTAHTPEIIGRTLEIQRQVLREL